MKILLFLTLMQLSYHQFFEINAKKAKKVSKIKYPEIGSHKRPNDIEADLYCATCLAVVETAINKLGKSNRESDIYEVLETVC